MDEHHSKVPIRFQSHKHGHFIICNTSETGKIEGNVLEQFSLRQ